MKLVLFDIDGTLIYHVGERHWGKQYLQGLELAYGITGEQDFEKYNGTIEQQMAWEITRQNGITRDEFIKKFPLYVQAMHDHLESLAQQGPVFKIIPDAVSLVRKLKPQKNILLGILTGNAKRIAEWKLSHTGLLDYFSFGLYGDDATDRNALAKTVFEKTPIRDIVVIGDTVHDIRCGKAINAATIGVLTGMHADPSVMKAEHPDILVNSLLDPAVLHFFGV